MATVKILKKKISKTSKRFTDNGTQFRGPVVLSTTRKTDNS